MSKCTDCIHCVREQAAEPEKLLIKTQYEVDNGLPAIEYTSIHGAKCDLLDMIVADAVDCDHYEQKTNA